MIISVHGIGWLTRTGYGCVRSGLRQPFERGAGVHSLGKKGIFSRPFKNFGRLDSPSRMTAYAVALALRDAGIDYAQAGKQDIGIIGANALGSLQSDIEYFRDYVGSGRTLSRGNLFIYTLPSSPAGEAAIHFGLQGPLLYVTGEEDSLAPVLDTAEEMILDGETPVMLAGRAGEDEALYFVLAASRLAPVLCDISAARRIVETTPEGEGIVLKFSELLERKASCEDKTHLSRVAET